MKNTQPYVWIDGQWEKVKPCIISNVVNLGPIPTNALITSDGSRSQLIKNTFQQILILLG